MKTLSTLVAFFALVQIFPAQYCIDGRFDALAFSSTEIDSILNLPFGQNYNWQDTAIQNLKMDVYFPNAEVDPLEKRPLIVMIHAGGFYLGTRMSYRYYCREFAKRGYVAATVDYRIGWDVGLGQHYDTLPMPTQISAPFACQGDSISSIKALYRALQDQKAAIRYLVHYADTIIHVDTNYIFVGGGSAGGVSSLGLQYIHQEFFDTEFAYLNLTDSLGPLDSSSNSLTDSFSLAGIVSMWGAIPDTTLITPENSLPTLFIHCTGDSLVPCVDSHFYSCSNYVPAQGACVMKTRMQSLNQCFEFNYFDAPFPQNGCHDVYSKDYHIERISKFVKRVLCEECRQIIIENQVQIADDTLSTSVPSIHRSENREIYVFPNPTRSEISVIAPSRISKVEVFNLQGTKVKSVYSGDKTTRFSIDDLSNNMYLIKVSLQNGTILFRKIVKI